MKLPWICEGCGHKWTGSLMTTFIDCPECGAEDGQFHGSVMEDNDTCCDFNGCIEKGTTMGNIYGHEKGSGKADKLIMVRACDEHAKRNDFFPNEPICTGEVE
jgi:predicted  nucleic acid-binding Zn-ribbon protein